MKMLTSPRSAFAVLLAAIMLCAVMAFPTTSAKATTREIKLLMLYDKSYEAFFAENNLSYTIPERIRQMVVLANIPFEIQWDIQLDVTVLPYASTLGVDPALSCFSMYPYDEGSTPSQRPTRHWEYDVQCNCSQTHDEHHSNASYYTQTVRDHFSNSMILPEYDDIGIVVAHKLCWSGNGNHTGVLGLGSTSNPGFIILGTQAFNSGSADADRFYNWVYTKYLFSHEFSHNFGAHDGYSNTSCTVDSPCIMNTGFQYVIYARDIWCTACHDDFDPAQFD